MFDNLRQQATGGTPYEDDGAVDLSPAEEIADEPERGRRGSLFGMSAAQRFVLALMLFLNVLVLGVFCLLATEKIAPF